MGNQNSYKKNRDLSINKTMKGGMNNSTQKITLTLFIGKDGMYLQTPDIVTVENTDTVTKGTKITKKGLKNEIGKVFKDVITKYKASLKSNGNTKLGQNVSNVLTDKQPNTNNNEQKLVVKDNVLSTHSNNIKSDNQNSDVTNINDGDALTNNQNGDVNGEALTNNQNDFNTVTDTKYLNTDTQKNDVNQLDEESVTLPGDETGALAVAITIAKDNIYENPIEEFIENAAKNEVAKLEDNKKKSILRQITSFITQSDKKTKEIYETAKKDSFVPSYLIKEVIICSSNDLKYIRNSTSLCNKGMKSYKCIMPTIFSLPSCLKYDNPVDLPASAAPFWKVSDNNKDPLRMWILDFCDKLEYFYNKNKSYAGVTTGGLFGINIRDRINSTVKNIGDNVSTTLGTKYSDLKEYNKKIDTKINELKEYQKFINEFSKNLPTRLNYGKINKIYEEITKFEIIIFFNSKDYEVSTIFDEKTKTKEFNKNNPLGIINNNQIVQINPLLSKIGIIVNNIKNDLYIVYSFYNLYLKHDTNKILKIQKQIFEVIYNVDTALVNRADEVNHHYSKTIVDGLQIISKELVGVHAAKEEYDKKNKFRFNKEILNSIMDEYKSIILEWHKHYKIYIKTYEESITKLLYRVEKSNEIFKSLHNAMKETNYKVNHTERLNKWNKWSIDNKNNNYLDEIKKDFNKYYEPQTKNFDKLTKEYEINLKKFEEEFKKLQNEFNVKTKEFDDEKAKIELEIAELIAEDANINLEIQKMKSDKNNNSTDAILEFETKLTNIKTQIDDKNTIKSNKKSELEDKKWNLEHFEKSKPKTPESLDTDKIYKQIDTNIKSFNKNSLTNDQLYKIFLWDVTLYERAYGRALNVNFSNIINLRFSLCNETRLTQFFNKSGINYAIGGVNMVKNSVYSNINNIMWFLFFITFGSFFTPLLFINGQGQGGQRTMKRKVIQNVKKRKTGKIRKVIENDITNNPSQISISIKQIENDI